MSVWFQNYWNHISSHFAWAASERHNSCTLYKDIGIPIKRYFRRIRINSVGDIGDWQLQFKIKVRAKQKKNHAQRSENYWRNSMFIDHGDWTRSYVHSTFIDSRSVDVRRYRMSARVSSDSTKCTLHTYLDHLYQYIYSNIQYKHLVHLEMNDTELFRVCVWCAWQSAWCVSIVLSNDLSFNKRDTNV